MRVEFEKQSAAANDQPRDAEISIVKFGSAVLRTRADLPSIVTEIYRHVREGSKVVAILSTSVEDAARQLKAECDAVGIEAETFADQDDKSLPKSFGGDVAIVQRRSADQRDEFPISNTAHRKLRVAVAGLGLIGEGVALRLGRDNSDYDFCAALVREPFKERPSLDVDRVTNDLTAFLATKPDVVIDALPDGGKGRALINSALARGVSVVTANKQAIAGALAQLSGIADQAGASLCYSASVGGGATFVETVERARASGDILSIEAALNGTVNYILTALSHGERFDDAIKAAQIAGFAEPDPSADLSGADARAKISILSYAAFGEEIDHDRIEIEALDEAKAARFAQVGGRWKQMARLEKTASGLTARLRFERRDDDKFFADALWEANALRIRLADGGVVECRGKGAGRRPTVESILGDLGWIRRSREAGESPAVLTREAVSA